MNLCCPADETRTLTKWDSENWQIVLYFNEAFFSFKILIMANFLTLGFYNLGLFIPFFVHFRGLQCWFVITIALLSCHIFIVNLLNHKTSNVLLWKHMILIRYYMFLSLSFWFIFKFLFLFFKTKNALWMWDAHTNLHIVLLHKFLHYWLWSHD